MSETFSVTRKISKLETLRREEARREKYRRAIDAAPADFADPFEFDEDEILDIAEMGQCAREREMFA